MRIICDIVIAVRHNRLSAVVEELHGARCRMDGLEIEEEKEDEDTYRAVVAAGAREDFEEFLARISASRDLCRVVSVSYRAERLIAGGLLNVCGKAPLEGRRDLEINLMGAAEIICGRLAEGRGTEVTGVTRNTAFVCVEYSGESPEPESPLARYVEAERDAIILNRFTGLNAFPLILTVQHPEDLARGLERLAKGFSAYRIMNLYGVDLIMYEQLLPGSGIPVLVRDLDEIPLYLLSVMENAVKKYRIHPAETTIGLLGIDAGAVRLARLLDRRGFNKVLGYDPGEREMLAIEDNCGLATTAENIFANSDITILLKNNFDPGEFRHLRPGQIVISLIGDRQADASAARGKGVREFAVLDFRESVSLFPGLLRGMRDHAVQALDDDRIIALAGRIAESMTDSYRLPDCFSDIHERIARFFNEAPAS